MSLSTKSKFYYGHVVDTTNNKIDFDEGAAELTATLNTGSYSLEGYVDEVKRAMDAVGALTYTVSVARSTRLITISAVSNFTLRISSGSNASVSAYGMIGFSGANQTGTNTYTGATASGSAYTSQFAPQDYVSSDDLRKAVEASVATTASGRVQVVSFGSEEFFEMNLRFCTNISQPSSGPITSSSTGVDDIRSLMQYLITKAPVEFMPDKDDSDTYYQLILESTSEDNRGIGYRLRERYDIGIPGYYDTGVLKFRVVE
jgi:hypothetical protein